MKKTKLENYYQITFLSLASILTLLIYLQGVNGPFLFDDFSNLSKIAINGEISTFENALNVVFGNTSGFLGRPVSMLTFMLNGNWPSEPFYFKLTNILLHIIIGWVIYYLSYLIIIKLDQKVHINNARWIASVTAAIWLLHPLHVSTTLYVIQRMAQLSTLFSLSAIVIFIKYSERLTTCQSLKNFITPSILLFITISLAIFSKENSILIFPILMMLHQLLNFEQKSQMFRLWFFTITVLPFIIAITYWLYFIKTSSVGYEFNGFTLEQRAFSELRIVTDYLFQIALPDSSRMSIFHDDFQLSKSLFEPFSTFLSAIFLTSIFIIALISKNRLFKFSIYWFFIWHLIESTLIPLMLYFEHRNYTASIGIILGLVYGLYLLFHQFRANKTYNKFYVLVMIAILSFQIYNLNSLTKRWANEEQLYTHWLSSHEKSKLTFLSLIDYHEKQRNIGLAYRLASEAIKYPHFQNDIGIYLKLYTHQCILRKNTDKIMDKLILLSTDRNSYNSTTLTLMISLMLNINAQACKPQSYEKLHQLFDTIAITAPQKASIVWQKAIFEKHAYIYLSQGNLLKAVKLFKKAYATNKPEITLAIIDLSIKLKNYTDAKKWINLAEHNISLSQYGQRDISIDLESLKYRLNTTNGN